MNEEITIEEARAEFARKYGKAAGEVTIMIRDEYNGVALDGKPYTVKKARFAVIDGKYVAFKSPKHNLGYNGRRRDANFEKVLIMIHKATSWEKAFLIPESHKEAKS